MSKLVNYVPDAELFVALEPEALAGYLLSVLRERGKFICGNEWGQVRDGFPDASSNFPLKMAFSAAWQYLRNEGLIGPHPEDNGWEIVTKRGFATNVDGGIDDLSKRTLLSKKLLHSSLRETTYSQFLSGNYELAVIQAYKQVEIAVRDKSLLKSLNGVSLMRAAFKPKNVKGVTPGPLTDSSLDPAEQEGLMNIFVGAMGWCRNPVHHREVELSLEQAIQMISFASYLLSLVDRSECVPSRIKSKKIKKTP